ncbi:MAG: DUF488 family protein [Actinomycetia bacterium]|nr:DUF488 family protein [Actinomycetes bacterium]
MGRVGEPSPPGVWRVLVDRLWPRGVRKDAGLWDVWLPDVAPSSPLRRWYHAHPEAWAEFRERYRRELDDPVRRAALDRIRAWASDRPVRLLTAGRDPARSQIPVLLEALRDDARG